MAYLDATDWLDFQSTNATNEKRFAELGVVDAVKESSAFVDYISPSEKQRMAESSSLRDVQIPVIKDQTVSVNQSPGFANIPDNLTESAQYAYTPVDVFSGFRHYPGLYANNAIDEAFDKRTKMENVAYAMANQIETLTLSTLLARSTKQLGHTTPVSQGDGTFQFSTSTDTLTVNKAAQKETMFYNLSTLMQANELPGNYRIVTSRAGLAVQKSEAAKYGQGNEKNLGALGFLGMDRLHESGNISAGSDVFSGYFLRDGSIGYVENFPYDFRAGTSFAGKNWSITGAELPYCRMRANIYTNNEATDATALVSAGTDSNLQMTHFQEMAIWIRFYIVYRYNSDLANRVNDIVYTVGSTS